MAHSTGPLLALVLTFAVLAGCADPEPRLLGVPGASSSVAEGDGVTEASPATGTAADDQVKPAAQRSRVEVYNLTATMSGATVFEDTFEAPPGTTWLGFGISSSSQICAGVYRLTILDSGGNERGAENWDCMPLGGLGCIARVTCQLRGFDATPGTYRVVYDVVGVVHLDMRAYAYVEPEPQTSQPSDPASQSNTSEQRHENVYAFAGLVIGASPANPASGEFGPLVKGQPPAKVATFEVPNGTVRLQVGVAHIGLVGEGVGTFRVEITGPDGSLVYSSIRQYAHGAGGSFCLFCGYYGPKAAGPGTYTVSYYVVGAFDLRVQVDATVV